ncbi:maleylacetoacetate isomerase [Candidatus Berkiella aquae]|uniref:Maleylacetoacetate isomerase n=1 Tax=Candidatus Berkiella aquae TaxID=295108 RepID=A0AAE3LAZ4_9GAMM|nr:maleylacetoacetate isomerase [Candidatus Berkiella aquae]MCS5712414.1 maleylacetoacetate isomerase [Candidatus Berkiella aquae]
MKLYDYFRSSASFRVRIALNLKGIAYDLHHVHLVKEGGQQLQSLYANINPQKLVPSLESDDGLLTQSLAIIEFLDEQYPEPALLPQDAILRAHVRAFAQHIACEIHPLNNLRVLRYLVHSLNITEEQKISWYHHWLREGFNGLEALLSQNQPQRFCFGDSPTLADLCLVPQIYNALRFEFDMSAYPRLNQVNEQCLKLDAFQKALPENHPRALDK